jgi:membrane protease YdiL (CAAX protease family)
MNSLTALEVLAVTAVLALNVAGVQPFATGTLLFVLPLGWLSLRARGLRWRSVGLRLPPRWPRALAAGLGGGVLLQAALTLLVDPLLKWAGVRAPQVEGVANMASGGVLSLLATLLLVWIVGGLLEEMCFRGYLLSRIQGLAAGRSGAVLAVVLSSAYFGLSHWYQGPGGAIEAAVTGAAFGAAYVLGGYNLFLPIVLHAAVDTAGVALLAMGFTGW